MWSPEHVYISGAVTVHTTQSAKPRGEIPELDSSTRRGPNIHSQCQSPLRALAEYHLEYDVELPPRESFPIQ